SFGHLSTRPAANAHLARAYAALTSGSRYAIQMRLYPVEDTEPSVPDEHNSWEFDLQGDTLRYTWYGTGINSAEMQELQRSRIEWLSGLHQGDVIETDHLMAIWDWDKWQAIVSANGFEQVATVEFSNGTRELPLGPNLYDNPYVWHILERRPARCVRAR
ncbi:MAG: hypothetical protein ACE1ZA_08815, partial [Pseudomonadales bacterium]